MSDPCMSTEDELEEVEQELEIAWRQAQKASEKLETIKTHLDLVPYDDDWGYEINPIDFNRLMKNLYSTLKDEPNSGGTQI